MAYPKFTGTRSISILLIVLFCNAGCLKDYSYEGGNLPQVDSTDTTDTTLNTPLPLPFSCALCAPNDPVKSMHWQFKYGASAMCGPVTNALLSRDKKALTFFGPSACTIDTGLIMTAFFDTPLDGDRAEVLATRAVLQYYNKNAAEDVFRSDPNHRFTFLIVQYTEATQTATGQFKGYAYTPDSTAILVDSGTFNIHF